MQKVHYCPNCFRIAILTNMMSRARVCVRCEISLNPLKMKLSEYFDMNLEERKQAMLADMARRAEKETKSDLKD